jgi:hypothetical protein
VTQRTGRGGPRYQPTRLAIVSLAAAATTVAAAGGHSAQAPNLSASRLAAGAAEYVRAYQEDFAFLLADERTVQRVDSQAEGSGAVETTTRVTRGEFFITYLPARRHWTAVRDVAEVDGAAVADRPDVAGLLAGEQADAVARHLFALNARYNIGRVARNFNDPMLALLPLTPAHRSRFSFSVGPAVRPRPGVAFATLRFRERERPTLVRGQTGASVYGRGELTVEPTTGVVRRARIGFRYDDIDVDLATDFARDERLGLWVPSRFAERYTSTQDGRREVTTVDAEYSNYRRFDVRSRLGPVGRPGDP